MKQPFFVITCRLLATAIVSYQERGVIPVQIAGLQVVISSYLNSVESWLQGLYYGAWKSVASNLTFSLLPALLIVLLIVCILLLLYSCNL
jgi:hypothetical protein